MSTLSWATVSQSPLCCLCCLLNRNGRTNFREEAPGLRFQVMLSGLSLCLVPPGQNAPENLTSLIHNSLRSCIVLSKMDCLLAWCEAEGAEFAIVLVDFFDTSRCCDRSRPIMQLLGERVPRSSLNLLLRTGK